MRLRASTLSLAFATCSLPVVILFNLHRILWTLHAPPIPKLHAELYDQRLSHITFHSKPVRQALLNVVNAPRASIAVVGVEWGAEVFEFASMRRTVYAVEPVKKFADYVAQKAKQLGLDIKVFNVAAASEPEKESRVRYKSEVHNETVYAKTARVDDVVNDRLAVLTIDIQGKEYDVLRGCTRLLRSGNVLSIVRTIQERCDNLT